jgi:peroxiredoxin
VRLALVLVIAVSVALISVRAHRTAISEETVCAAPAHVRQRTDSLDDAIIAFHEEWADLQTRIDAAPNDAERQRILLSYQEACPAAQTLLKRACSAPDGPQAVAALGKLVSRLPNAPVGRDAAKLLLAQYAHDESIELCFDDLMKSESDLGLEILSAAYHDRTDSRVKGLASFALACLLKTRAEREGWRNLPGSRGEVAEARALFEEVANGYSGVRAGRGMLGELARAELDELQTLCVGQTAPEISGEDLIGQPMKLSDYRGMVVVLAFWGNWCSLCRSMLPYERALVDSMKGRPFVLLGVNSDSGPSFARSLVEDGTITWRSWSDGGELYGGPIARRWNVQPLPDFFILDDRGVIRHHVGPRSDDHGPLYFLDADGRLLHRWKARSDDIQDVAESLVREVGARMPPVPRDRP